jgi:phosphoribosylglycinamide formyltransferase 1
VWVLGHIEAPERQARGAHERDPRMTRPEKLPLVVLISGGGSNLQAIIDRAADGSLPVEIRGVISNQADAFGLERARRADLPTCVIDHRDYPDRESYDAALMQAIDDFAPGLVALAGFMRILTPALVRHYRGRMFNIHPSLLPRYPGLHTHRRALEAGDQEHGATVHFVTEQLDGGPRILAGAGAVHAGRRRGTLAARVLAREHILYPTAIRWFAEGRLGRRVRGPEAARRCTWKGDAIDADTIAASQQQ